MLHPIQTCTPSIDISAIAVPATTMSDDSLIQRVREGDINAYGNIMRRYNQRLYRIARSILNSDADALDIVQDAHVKAYTNIDNYQGNSKLAAWLSTITRNEALMRLRKLKREITMSEDELNLIDAADNIDQLVTSSCNPESCLENRQLRALLNQNIDQLPSDFREVFVLRAVEQLSIRETAEILSIKEETVKTRLFRAKRLLRAQIQSYLEEAGMHVYEVGGIHCDAIILNVLTRLQSDR